MNIEDILEFFHDRFMSKQKLYPVVGIVSDVDEDKRICTVTPVGDEGESNRVRFQAKLNIVAGMVIIPTDGSEVVMSWLNNETGFISLYSEIDKLLIDTALIEFNSNNGGQGKGMIDIVDLTTKLNNLKTEINTNKAIFNAHFHTTTATVGPTAVPGVIAPPAIGMNDVSNFSKDDYEDTKVKH